MRLRAVRRRGSSRQPRLRLTLAAMCEDSGMDEFDATYLRYDATLTLAPASYACAEPDRLAAYPAREVAAAIARARGVRGVSRRPPAHEPGQGDERATWPDRRWRWREGDRQIEIAFSVSPAAAPAAPDDSWGGSTLVARCHYADVARLALTLARRFPALRLLLGDDQRACSPSEFIASLALARLAPALASDDPATHERACATQALYAELLAGAPQPADPAAAFAAAPFTTLYEDAHLLAVNKPTGVVTHPTYKHPTATLTDAVFAQQAARGALRPWLLHRLDKATSGVVLFAKSDQARRSLASQFERHSAHKRYLALVVWPPAHGMLSMPGMEDAVNSAAGAEGEIDAPLARDPLDRRRVIVALDGQPSRTRYRLLGVAPGYALAQAEPVTGRTHQIRAHLAALGAPLVGDAAYLPADSPHAERAPRAMLHAWRLDVRYPGSEAPWRVVAPPPADFVATAEALGLGEGLRAALDAAKTEA